MFTVHDEQFEYHLKSASYHRARSESISSSSISNPTRARFALISSSSMISSCSANMATTNWFPFELGPWPCHRARLIPSSVIKLGFILLVFPQFGGEGSGTWTLEAAWAE